MLFAPSVGAKIAFAHNPYCWAEGNALQPHELRLDESTKLQPLSASKVCRMRMG